MKCSFSPVNIQTKCGEIIRDSAQLIPKKLESYTKIASYDYVL